MSLETIKQPVYPGRALFPGVGEKPLQGKEFWEDKLASAVKAEDQEGIKRAQDAIKKLQQFPDIVH